MRWRRLGSNVAAALTGAAVISMTTLAVVAFGGAGGGDAEHSGDLGRFDACIAHTRFLVLVRHGGRSSVVDTIRDRAHRVVVGEVAAGRTPSVLGGAAAGDGRYVMSTATPLGRDAGAIERCWDGFSPIAPDP